MNQYQKTDLDFISSIYSEKNTDRPPVLISEYIQRKREMPPGSPFPGPFEIWRSPYCAEIMDCFSPYNPARWIDVMAAAQTVKSITLESVIGYGMDANPSPMLFVSGTDELLMKWGPKRLEPLIDSLGIRHKMVAPIESEKSRSTGDKIKQKLFAGGFLEMASAQSPSSLRSDSIKYLLLDEVDSAPPQLTTGEGRWDRVAEARTKAWEARKKIGAFSTPTLYDTSIIYDRFLLGDQCEFFVPCPLCGKEQTLVRGSEQSAHGLRADTTAGELNFVYYLCEYCHNAIFEHQKTEMMIKGRWIPQAKPEKFRRSFTINSLYSPVGLYSWMSYWMEYQIAIKTPDGMRSFTNLQDGQPYREKGSKPKLESVINLRGTYRAGTVPDNILFLTMAVDVQRGSENDDKNPARLELEVLGHGAQFRTASILYHVIEGPVNDFAAGSWAKLNEWALKTKMRFQRRDGLEFPIAITFIDSGFETDVVYAFCKNWTNTYPIKGTQALKKNTGEKGDEAGPGNFRPYKPSKIGENYIYSISTNYYKKHIYNNLNNSVIKIEKDESRDQPGFCDFPFDYPDDYFVMLTAEEHRRDGSFYKSRHVKNESLDLRVYGMCAGDVHLNSIVMNLKLWKKSNGGTQADIAKINHVYALNYLREEIDKAAKKSKKT